MTRFPPQTAGPRRHTAGAALPIFVPRPFRTMLPETNQSRDGKAPKYVTVPDVKQYQSPRGPRRRSPNTGRSPEPSASTTQ